MCGKRSRTCASYGSRSNKAVTMNSYIRMVTAGHYQTREAGASLHRTCPSAQPPASPPPRGIQLRFCFLPSASAGGRAGLPAAAPADGRRRMTSIKWNRGGGSRPTCACPLPTRGGAQALLWELGALQEERSRVDPTKKIPNEKGFWQLTALKFKSQA